MTTCALMIKCIPAADIQMNVGVCLKVLCWKMHVNINQIANNCISLDQHLLLVVVSGLPVLGLQTSFDHDMAHLQAQNVTYIF